MNTYTHSPPPRTCHVALGTPGRLCALLEQGLLPTGRLRLLVLDEADKLLEGDLADDVEWIAALMPGCSGAATDQKHARLASQSDGPTPTPRCQVLALSATFAAPVRERVTALMHRPQPVLLSPDDVSLVGVAQRYVVLPGVGDQVDVCSVWRAWLLELLSRLMFAQAVVFCNRKGEAAWLADQLQGAGYAAAYVAGGQSQVCSWEASRFFVCCCCWCTREHRFFFGLLVCAYRAVMHVHSGKRLHVVHTLIANINRTYA